MSRAGKRKSLIFFIKYSETGPWYWLHASCLQKSEDINVILLTCKSHVYICVCMSVCMFVCVNVFLCVWDKETVYTNEGHDFCVQFATVYSLSE